MTHVMTNDVFLITLFVRVAAQLCAVTLGREPVLWEIIIIIKIAVLSFAIDGGGAGAVYIDN